MQGIATELKAKPGVHDSSSFFFHVNWHSPKPTTSLFPCEIPRFSTQPFYLNSILNSPFSYKYLPSPATHHHSHSNSQVETVTLSHQVNQTKTHHATKG